MLTVAGLVPFTTIDYPGKLAAVIFLQGCPLKCPFCHNKTLQTEGTPTDITLSELDIFLNNRRRLLDGIVLSGGEPLKHKEVIDLINKIKALNYLVGVHTSGVYPDHLGMTLELIDWVGLDIKAPWKKYELLTGRKGMEKPVQESLNLLTESGKEFECRTTCDPRYLTKDDILKMAKDLSGRGVQTYYLQKYRTFDGDINPPDESAINSFFTDREFQDNLKSLFPNFGIR